MVNLDELDYLAKRLDSFDVGEAAQFQAMAHKLELFELKDLINLTFCRRQATVITDFSDLEAIGRDHYMNLHGGCASTQELEDLDGEETAVLLIEGGNGTVTRYGVVYDNGMEMYQSYDGKHFPAYFYEPAMLMVALTSRLEPEDTKGITWLYLPAARGQIERAMARSGIADPEDMRFRFAESMFPDEVDVALDFQYLQAVKQFEWTKAELLRAIEAEAHLELTLDESEVLCYTENEQNEMERTDHDQDTLPLSWKYLQKPDGRVCNERYGEESGTGAGVPDQICGDQHRGDRQSGLSACPPQIGRAWHRMLRQNSPPASEQRL